MDAISQNIKDLRGLPPDNPIRVAWAAVARVGRGGFGEDPCEVALVNRCGAEWRSADPPAEYVSREIDRYPLHPLALALLGTAKWLEIGMAVVLPDRPGLARAILDSWPHVPTDGDRSRIAWTSSPERGAADKQTKGRLGSYLASLGIPGHEAEKIVHDYRLTLPGDERFETLSGLDMARFMQSLRKYWTSGLSGGTVYGSCMAEGRWKEGPHPYEAYREYLGWRLAVRYLGDIPVARALYQESGGWVRSYGRDSGGDPALEAWLRSQGHEKIRDWTGYRIDGNGLIPYIDPPGGCQYGKWARDGEIEVHPSGELELDNTDGKYSLCKNMVETISGDMEDIDDCVYLEYRTNDGDRVMGYALMDVCIREGDDWYLDEDAIRVDGQDCAPWTRHKVCDACGDYFIDSGRADIDGDAVCDDCGEYRGGLWVRSGLETEEHEGGLRYV
jgi:hypothetical protein